MLFATLVVLLFISGYGLCKKEPKPLGGQPWEATYFGKTLKDPYHYFSNDSYRGSVVSYLQKESDYAKSKFDNHLLKDLRKEAEQYEGKASNGTSTIVGNFKYTKFTPNIGYGAVWYQDSLDGKSSQIVLREEEVQKRLNRAYFKIARFIPSPDGKFVAYSYDVTGEERFSVEFLNVETGKIASDVLHDCFYGFAWSSDSKYFMYEKLGALDVQPVDIFTHEVNSTSADVSIHHVTDLSRELSLSMTSDLEYILITENSFHGQDIYIIALSDFTGIDVSAKVQHFQTFEENINYYVDHSNGFWYMMTQADNSINYKVVQKSGNSTKTLLPSRSDAVVEKIKCFNKFIAIWQYNTTSVLPFITVFDVTDLNTPIDVPIDAQRSELKEIYAVDDVFDETVCGGEVGFNNDFFDLSYSSLSIPPMTYRFDLEKKTLELQSKVSIDGYDHKIYREVLHWVHYVDNSTGTPANVTIPVTFVRKHFKSSKKHKKIKFADLYMWLYTYGAYGTVVKPSFDSGRISMMDRNFIFAIAHVRGSSILGMDWYEQGKLLNKKHTFADLVAVIENLIQHGYTTKQKLLLNGRSAGGLSVMATTVMRNDLMNMTIAEVPFCDVMNTMLDPTLSYTEEEYAEWGNPSNNKEDFNNILSYDPYYNFKDSKVQYPNIYFETGYNDARVGFYEPTKFMNTFRHWNKNKKTEQDNMFYIRAFYQGHLGADTVDKKIEQRIEKQALALKIISGWVWHDPLEWLWILLCIIVLGIWMVCFMMIFIVCELHSKRKRKNEDSKESEESENVKEDGYGALDDEEEEQEQKESKGVEEEEEYQQESDYKDF